MFEKFYLFILIVVLAISTISCHKKTDHEGLYGELSLIVKDESGSLVTGYSVAVQNAKSQIRQSDINEFEVTLLVGDYQVTVHKEGMIGATLQVEIKYKETTELNVVLKRGEPFLNLVSDSVIRSSSNGATYNVEVESNGNWTAVSDASWIKISNDNFYGNKNFPFSLEKNEGDSARTARIRLSMGDLQKEIHITQGAELRIMETRGMPGNFLKGQLPRVVIKFNQNVSVEQLRSEYNLCQSAPQIIAGSDSSHVEFSYGCGWVGGTYPFHISVRSSFGDPMTKTIDVGFYSKNLKFNGNIISYYVNDADNSFWFLIGPQYKLLKIDMNTLGVLSEFSLSKKPTLFTINPYNDKIYLGYEFDSTLYVLNQDFTPYDEIPISLDSSRLYIDHYGHLQPEVFPVKLRFTKSGIGLLSLSFDNSTENSRFWIIDASEGHKLFYTEDETMDWSSHEIKSNYDKTKLIFTTPYTQKYFYVFDPLTLSFEKITSGRNSSIMEYVTPSRINQNVYFNQYLYQGVINMETKTLAAFATTVAPDFSKFDFLYGGSGENRGLRCGEGVLELVDFDRGETPAAFKVFLTFQILTNTIDGKFCIIAAQNGNGNIWLFQLPIAWVSN